MKYILIASLLSSAAYAAPFRGQGLAAAIAAGQQQRQQAAQQGGAVQGGAQQGAQTGGAAQNQPIGQDTGLGAPLAAGQTPTAGDLATAVSNWMADTSMVSNFLDIGKSIQDDTAFKQAALVAFNAEVDELDHKAIIDAANGNQPAVQAANSTLAGGGSFQDVVDKLKIMADQGRAAVQNIDLILQNRCVNVLPNIDAYMASTGSSSQAVRPKVCDQTGIVGGVQGNGPTQPGDAPGTPAAAFAAAKALAQGTGNGVVQNGGNAQGAAGQQGQGGRKGLGGLGRGGAGANAGAGTGAGRLGQGAGAGAAGAGRLGQGAGAATGAGRIGQKGAAGAATGGAGGAGAGRLGAGAAAGGAGAGAGAGRLGQKGTGAATGGAGAAGQAGGNGALRAALAAKFGAGKNKQH